MKKKGFTLIELLAVIVILAVIALIATPLVLNTIDKAKKGAAKASALEYMNAVERYVVEAMLDTTMPQLQAGVEYQLSSTNYEVAALADPNTVFINDLIQIKGDKPESGYLVVNNQGTVEEMEMIMNDYPVECSNNKCEVTGDKEEDNKVEEEIIEPILNKAKALVYNEDGTCKTDGTTYNYMGGCYIKGANTSNYVWYNGFMWRIMGINSDNTVRLITDENVISLEGSEIQTWLNDYFYNSLNSTKSLIQEGTYFCNDSTNGINLTEGRTTCTSGSEITTKIGLISADEYLLSNISESYLNIGQISWTMTNFYNDESEGESLYVIRESKYLSAQFTNTDVGVRPIINIASNTVIKSGIGTATKFYMFEENDQTEVVSNTIGNKTTLGEYVILEGHTYRVVSKDDTGVKLILDGYYEEPAGTLYKMLFGTGTENGDIPIFSKEADIGLKLNTDVLNWLGLTNSDKLIEKRWSEWQDTLSADETYVDYAKVGLISRREPLSSFSSTMLTKKYTVASNYDNVDDYWALYETYQGIIESQVSLTSIGYQNHVNAISNQLAIRPVIVVRNDLEITSGTGTWKSPYQI